MTRIDEIRNRLNAATPGPWEVRNMHATPYSVVVFHGRHEHNETIIQWLNGHNSTTNVDLVVNAPTDLAWLLDEVERLRAGIEAHFNSESSSWFSPQDMELWSLLKVTP